MSTPLNRTAQPWLRERSACMCAQGEVCSSFAAGHGLHLIQARLASATPAEWVDAIVERTDAATGELVVRTLEGQAHTLWNATGAALEAAEGTPVALHVRYGVLAVGRAQFNVATV
ncbi:MAG: hypothetical protein QM630_09515 [Microbacterium sp.]